MIPVSSTTITVRRSSTEDAYDVREPLLVASGVRAVIDEPGTARSEGVVGQASFLTQSFVCDPCDIRPGDTVTDDLTGVVYTAAGASPGPSLIPHTSGTLEKIGYPPR